MNTTCMLLWICRGTCFEVLDEFGVGLDLMFIVSDFAAGGEPKLRGEGEKEVQFA